MAISRVPGFSLLANLDRQGTDVFISSNGQTLFYWDVNNYRVGINQSTPQQALDVNGNILIANGHVYTGANIQFDIGSQINQWRTVYANTVWGTLQTNVQPNITTVGNITNLNIIGNLTVGGVAFANVVTSGNLNAGNNQIIWVGSPIVGTDAANKDYVDQQVVGTNFGNLIPLGTATDGNLSGNNAAYQGFTTSTKVTDAIDILNSVAQNLFTNTFVRSVSFSSNTTAGGVGQTILLTMVPQGNVNQYEVQWGDGTSNTTSSSSTITHTYATNVGTPYTIIVTANNTNGASPSNTAGAVRTNYITIYAADPAMGFGLFRANISASPLTGNDLYSIQGNAIYLQNTTTNTNTATVVTWSVNWGDGTYANVPNNSSAGGATGPYANKTYVTNTGSGTLAVNLALLTSDITNPAILPRFTATTLKVYGNSVNPPAGLNTKTLTFTGSVGTNATLTSGAIDNTGGTALAANASVSRTIATGSTLISANSGNVSSSFTWSANIGYLQAVVNGVVQGNANIAATTSPTVTGNLGILGFSDYWLLTSAGAATTFASSTYYPGYYWGFRANVMARGDIIPAGINRFGLNHSSTGITANIEFVKDDVTTVPTVTAGTLAIKAPGTYRYISGIPYFNTGSPQLWWQNVTINSWIGQTWNNTANVAFVVTGTNLEGSSGNVILANAHPYASLSNVSSPALASGTPIAGTGNVSAYSAGNLTVVINQASVRSVANLRIVVTNVNGTSAYAEVVGANLQVHTASQSGISEIAISANTSANTNPAVRSTYFLANTIHTPAYARLTNFMTAPNVYTEASDPGVAGTKEATIRLGVLRWTANNYSTGYLPIGPNRSGDGGSYQYFTMGFQRTGVSNFNLNIVAPAGVAGVWIAAPGTTIDSTSGLNGWLTATTSYAGSGIPGSNTGAGGNGSDGCGSGALIAANVALNGTFTMTLGTISMSSATNNVALIRIALASGQTVSTLAVS
jgi:hypothetical protein